LKNTRSLIVAWVYILALQCGAGFSSDGPIERAKLKKIDEIRLEAPPSAFMGFVVHPEGMIFCAPGDENQVYMLSPKGELIRKIGHPGFGPGEFASIGEMLLLENGNTLVVAETNGRISKFNTATGEFLGMVQKYFICYRTLKWDEKTFVSVQNQTDQFFTLLSLDGDIGKSWFPDPPRPIVWTRKHAVALGPEREIFFQEGTRPEIWVIPDGKDYKTVWELLKPKHYREPPEKPFNTSYAYDRVKIQEYFESYTHLERLVNVNDTFLLVVWAIHEPYSHSVDIYDIRTRELLGRSRMPGKYVAASGELVYFFENHFSDDPADDEYWQANIFEIKRNPSWRSQFIESSRR